MRRHALPLVLLTLAVGAVAGFRQMTPAAPAAAARSGDEFPRVAPSFAVKTLEGRWLKSSDLKGRPMVVDFWATWCGPCRASMPHLDAIQERYRDRGLVVVGLSVDDGEPQLVRRFADRLGIGFDLAMADEKVLDRFGPIRSIPTTFFINRRGEIVRRVVGYVDEETLESYVRETF